MSPKTGGITQKSHRIKSKSNNQAAGDIYVHFAGGRKYWSSLALCLMQTRAYRIINNHCNNLPNFSLIVSPTNDDRDTCHGLYQTFI